MICLRASFCSSDFTPSRVKAPTRTTSTQATSTQMATCDTVGRWKPPVWAMAKVIATTPQPIHRHGPTRYRKACRKPNQVKNANQGLRMVSTALNTSSPMK